MQDNNGTTWRCNGAAGFFNDTFEGTTLHTDWISLAGTWSNSTNALYQSDEATPLGDNTNVYAALTQNNSATYLYAWQDKISGTGTNRRAGIHFFADDATQSNRGNSYFIYYRADSDKMQLYKTTANVFTMVLEIAITVDIDTWYNHKVSYNPATGKIDIYRNNTFVGTWTDTSPLTTGNFISARSGNCKYWVDNLQVFKSRGTTAAVSIGTATTDMVRYQSNNTTTNAGRVLSAVIDNTTWVATDTAAFKVDWTNPTVATINDGTGADVDITTSTNTLSGNWLAATDTQSGIASYSYSIGTTAGSTNILAWTNNGMATNFTQTGLSLSYGQTYFVNVKAINGAGLETISSSDGIQLPCDTPTNVTLTTNSLTTTAASFTWTAVAGATSYNVNYRVIGAATWISATSITNSIALSGLTNTTNYELQVATVCSVGTSAYTLPINFTTLTPCGVPSGITISGITATSANISWAAISGATSYTIRYRIVGTTALTSVSSTTNSITISALTSGTQYEVQVCAVCASGTSAYSSLTNFTTLTSCGTPTGIVISSITTSTATATWAAVSGATSYTIRYRKVGVTTWTSTTSTTNSKALSALSSASTYEIQVRSTCTSGTSSYSTLVNFVTLTPCGVPTGLFTNQLTTTDARVNWTAVNTATSYTVQRRKVGNTTWLNTTTTTNYKYLGGFTACTNYEWRVSATCPSGTSAYTAVNYFTTTGCGASPMPYDNLTENSKTNNADNAPLLLTIEPNPANNYAELLYSSNLNTNVSLIISDVMGKIISNETKEITEGDNKIMLDITNLQSGYYIVMIGNKEQKQYARLVVVKQ